MEELETVLELHKQIEELKEKNKEQKAISDKYLREKNKAYSILNFYKKQIFLLQSLITASNSIVSNNPIDLEYKKGVFVDTVDELFYNEDDII